MPLTNIEIKNAQPRDKEYVMSDGSGLVVSFFPAVFRGISLNLSPPLILTPPVLNLSLSRKITLTTLSQ